MTALMNPGPTAHTLRDFVGVLTVVLTIIFVVTVTVIVNYGWKPHVTGPMHCTCVEDSPADAAPIDVLNVLTPEKP